MAGGVVDGNDYQADFTRTARTEIYHPDLGGAAGPGSWSVLDELAPRPRGYHSTALLTPDGEVWVAGSQYPSTKYSFHNEGGDPFDERGPHHDGLDANGNPVRNLELDIDVYAPDQVCCHRPRIDVAPDAVHCADTFTVYTPDAAGVARVAVVRAGTSTHAFNGDQRWVGLAFGPAAPGRLSVTAPPHTGIAPPGDYLLFLVDVHGIPSRGRFLRIHPGCAVAAILNGHPVDAATHEATAEGDAHRQDEDRDGRPLTRPGVARLTTDLQHLRDDALRTTPTGAQLAAMLDRHNGELVRLAATHPGLSGQLLALIRRLHPALVPHDRPRAFTDDDVAAGLAALDRVARQASPALADDLDRLRRLAPQFAGRTLPEALAAGDGAPDAG